MSKNAKQSLDTALVLVLLLLIAGRYQTQWGFVTMAIVLLLIAMLVPRIFSPLATLWFDLAESLGKVGSLFLLSVLFLLIVLPVGLARRVMGFDPMLSRAWKKGSDTVFRACKIHFTRDDIVNPY